MDTPTTEPSSTTLKPQSNPAWTRDELILALDLYLRHRYSLPSKHHPEVQELSHLLGRLGRALGLSESDSFRNANGVYMKLGNFRRWDPEYIKDGKTGLAKGNKDEGVVWDEFANAPAKLAAVTAAIRDAIDSPQADQHDLEGGDEPGIEEAEEGKVLTRLHRTRERKRSLVEAKKREALKKHGRLRCEACDFDFVETYGTAGQGIIDVHHTKPVHTLQAGEKTKLSELALVCANCHRVIHSSRKWLTIEQVRALRSQAALPPGRT